MLFALCLLLAAADAPLPGIEGEIGYRITTVPAESAAARAGLRLGDILADPAQVPVRLRAESPELPIFRLENGHYRQMTVKIAFAPGAERRLGTVGDFGFLAARVDPASPAAALGFRRDDFIPKIDDTFVHASADLKLAPRAKKIQVTRPTADGFENLVLPR